MNSFAEPKNVVIPLLLIDLGLMVKVLNEKSKAFKFPKLSYVKIKVEVFWSTKIKNTLTSI